ncbi:hypothetical protein CPC08DRAFT_25839 [Agrocybe pediades]|nr:hypothetical protein CPC08DRAFT_25839 [Agrocybe pediades]
MCSLEPALDGRDKLDSDRKTLVSFNLALVNETRDDGWIARVSFLFVFCFSLLPPSFFLFMLLPFLSPWSFYFVSLFLTMMVCPYSSLWVHAGIQTSNFKAQIPQVLNDN